MSIIRNISFNRHSASGSGDDSNSGIDLSSKGVPYWRLSSFYFWYFALLGATFPYWPLYLQSLGFSAPQIGLLLAIPMATKIIAPSIWGWLADLTGKRLAIIRMGSLLSIICFLGIFINQSFWLIALVMAGYSFFWNAVLPQFETITLGFLADKPETYSLLRLWGSVGFIIAVLTGGWWFEQYSTASLPVIGVLLLVGILISSWVVPVPANELRKRPSTNFLQACRQPAVMAFLAGGFLLQLAHGIYYSFFSIYLESEGYSRTSIGMLWAIGVIAEVLIFLTMRWLLIRMGARVIVLFSLLMAVIRWVLIGHFVDYLWLLLLAQVLHAFTFGTFHAAAIECVRRLFEPAHQGKGQAIYSGVSFGAGGAAGSLLGGVIWVVEPVRAYDLAALASLVALVIVSLWMKDLRLEKRAD